MLQLTVDNSAEIFGANVSIADLAQFSFNGEDSDKLHIYRADQILARDWRDELVDVDMEYLLSVRAKFKDGSALNVSAWADCCDGDGCRYCRGDY
jgi:hypothetical protein